MLTIFVNAGGVDAVTQLVREASCKNIGELFGVLMGSSMRHPDQRLHDKFVRSGVVR
jgi:hypothetical protein